MEFEKIFDGMPNGGDATGRNFTKVSNMISYQEPTRDGITLLNGAKSFVAEDTLRFGYQYVQIEGAKLVDLRIEISGVTKSNTIVAQLPKTIAPGTLIVVNNSGNEKIKSFVAYIDDGNSSGAVMIRSAQSTANADDWYPIHVSYLRKDD